MNHDFKIQLLQAECLVILGIMGIVIVLLIIEYIRRCRELNHSELVLHDAMGKFIYFINDDDDIDREILTGIRIEDDCNGHIAFFLEVPKDHRKRFIVTTASCMADIGEPDILLQIFYLYILRLICNSLSKAMAPIVYPYTFLSQGVSLRRAVQKPDRK